MAALPDDPVISGDPSAAFEGVPAWTAPRCPVCGLPDGHEAYLGALSHAVDSDLRKLPKLDTGVRPSLAQLARTLARAMDATGDDQPTPAQMGQLGQQLRATLQSLATAEGDNGLAARFFEIMSTAARRASRRTPR
jgi:hypothetical protein